MKLLTKTVTLGKTYNIGYKKYKGKCVLASPKGVNFLNEETNRMIFYRNFYSKDWVGKNKHIPKNIKDINITSVLQKIIKIGNEV